MFNIISRNYYVPKLTNWLQGKKMKCRTCLALERAPVVPATGATWCRRSPNKHGKSTTSDNFQQTAKHATGGHLMTLISELTREKNYESP